MAERGKAHHPRKLEIVHAAVACFLERGYHQTGVRDIATRAGISLGNLYNHFAGKDAVLVFIAEMEGEELSGFIDLLSEPDSPKDALERFIERYAVWSATPENALLGIEILTEALRNPPIAEVFEKNRNRLIDAIVACLSRGVQSGVFSAENDPREAALLILDGLEGYGLRAVSGGGSSQKGTGSIKNLIFNGLAAG